MIGAHRRPLKKKLENKVTKLNLFAIAIIIPTAVAVLSSGARAAGIRCVVDARPRDGAFREVKLQQMAGTAKFEIVEKVITSGMGPGGPKTTNTVLLSGLESCDQDGLVAYCAKRVDKTDPGNSTPVSFYSFVKVSIVETTEIDIFHPQNPPKAIKRAPKLQFELESDELKSGSLTFSFSIKSGEGSCSEL
jgi:hypothetical protein